MNSPPRKYDYLRYNRYDVLRLNWVYWSVTLFLSRHLILFILLGVSAGRTGAGPRNPELAALLDPLFFISDLPALFLLFLAGARLPKSGDVTRLLWRQGRYFLVASCILYMALLFWQHDFHMAGLVPLSWGLVALNLLLVGFVMRSAYLRDLFAEFPAPEDEAAT